MPKMSQVSTLKDSEFENNVVNGELPALVDFYADWCPPCRRLAPILESLSKEFAGKVNFYKINTEHQTEWAAKFGVQALPTLLFFRGGELVAARQGLQRPEQLRDVLTELIQSGPKQVDPNGGLEKAG